MVSVLSVTINIDLTLYEFKSQLTASVLKKDETDKKLTRIVCFLEGGGVSFSSSFFSSNVAKHVNGGGVGRLTTVISNGPLQTSLQIFDFSKAMLLAEDRRTGKARLIFHNANGERTTSSLQVDTLTPRPANY